MAASQTTFYSELRRGAALGIQREDFSTAPGPGSERAKLDVTLTFDAAHAAAANLTLIGPGDIIGLDPRTIVRMFPKADENEAEAEFLAYVEFDQADLPWRYTPAKSQGTVAARTDRIRPWISLIVLEEGTDFTDQDLKAPEGTAKLPLLTINDPDGLLPEEPHLWAWAHVHAQGTPAGDEAVADLMAGRPGALVARLMSPRRLIAQKAYRAFLVPTFKRGAMVGRGEDPGTTDALETSWTAGVPAPITLPVYHSWRFQTGVIGSFSDAARALAPLAALPDSMGLRDLDVSDPGFLLPPPALAPMQIGGALKRPPPPTPPEVEPVILDSFINGLASFIDFGQLEGQSLRVVAPPLYGRWFAAEDHLDQSSTQTKTNPPWFLRLNSDPRYRVAAALGTEVVQRDQQALMATALEQGARLGTVNTALKILQTGREVFTRLIDRHIAPGPKSTVFAVTAPVFGRVLSCAPGPGPKPTIGGVLVDTPFGGGSSLLPPWRRYFPGDASSPVGKINDGKFIPVPDTPPGMVTPDALCPAIVPGDLSDPRIAKAIASMDADERLYWGVVLFWVARKLLVSESGRYWWLLRKLLRLGLDLISLGSTQGVTYIGVAQKLCAGDFIGAITSAPPAPGFVAATTEPDLSDPNTWPVPQAPGGSGGDSAEAIAFRSAALALFGYTTGAPVAGRVLNKLDIPTQVNCILTAIAPGTTFVASAKSRFLKTRILAWNAADQLEPILVAPRVERPMWDSLRDVSLDWILPGIGDLPRNSVSLVKTNQKFIEAFMVGLNHEMTRELVWNGYPVDQRGTYFHKFWDFRGWVKGKVGDTDRTETLFDDVKPVSGWERTSALGSHTGRIPAGDHLVLLVRGDIIKRYPNVVVYAVKATAAGGLNDDEQQHPVFQSVLTGDIAFYGFELTQSEVRGNPGWYFVLQEHPSEPRFIQEEGSDPINVHPGDYDPSPTVPVKVAADVAKEAFNQPLRVAIHGKDLLPA